MSKPRINSDGQTQLDQAVAQVDAFNDELKTLANNAPNSAPLQETEQQTKISSREAIKYDAPYIKPERSIQCKEKPNEKYQKQHDYMWEYVKIIAENNEIIGEAIEMWTKQFAGDPAHFWKIPVNKPIYVPRLVAEQLTRCCYTRYAMEDKQNSMGSDGMGTYYSGMIAKNTVRRLNALPAGGFGKASAF
jgi:hypothetical protein